MSGIVGTETTDCGQHRLGRSQDTIPCRSTIICEQNFGSQGFASQLLWLVSCQKTEVLKVTAFFPSYPACVPELLRIIFPYQLALELSLVHRDPCYGIEDDEFRLKGQIFCCLPLQKI